MIFAEKQGDIVQFLRCYNVGIAIWAIFYSENITLRLRLSVAREGRDMGRFGAVTEKELRYSRIFGIFDRYSRGILRDFSDVTAGRGRVLK